MCPVYSRFYSEEQIESFLAGGAGSREAEKALLSLEGELSMPVSDGGERILRAIAASKVGAPPETVAKFLGWREFEMFCAALLRLRGYTVSENIVLTKPRAQIDLLARSASLALAVDCKHWKKGMGVAALAKAAEAQAGRVRALRSRTERLEPTVVVILVFTNEAPRFVNGAAVVPIYAFSSFLENPLGYSELLDFL
jgi:hypothetical protein